MRPANRGNAILILLVVVALVIVGVALFNSMRPQTANAPTMTTSSSTTLYGSGPCADCPGISYTLVLTPGLESQSGTFSLTMVYQERNVDPFTQQGGYTVANNILTLTPSGTNEQAMYYQVVSSTQVQQLDADKQPVPSPYNTILTTTPPTSSSSPNL